MRLASWLLTGCATLPAPPDAPAPGEHTDTPARAAARYDSSRADTPGADTPGADSPAADSPAADTSPEGIGTGDNLLILLLDDVGVDKIAGYGLHDSPARTPHIDALIAGGVAFTNAWAYPICSPTRAALQTGRYASRTGVGAVITPDVDTFQLQDAEVTLPEMLERSAHGYTSALVGKWHLDAWTSGDPRTHPLEQGFHYHRGSLANLDQCYAAGCPATTYDQWEKNTDGALGLSTVYATTDAADEAIALMAEMPEPWLLLVAFNAPHTPVHAPPEALLAEPLESTASDLLRYEAMIEAADTEIGRLMEALGDTAGRRRPTRRWSRSSIGAWATPSSARDQEAQPRGGRGISRGTARW